MSRFLVHHSMWADPRMVGLSPEASALWLRAGSWAAGHHTDGFVPDDAIPQIGGHAAAGELVRRGLFDRLGISRNRVSQIEADSPTSITDVGESDGCHTGISRLPATTALTTGHDRLAAAAG